MKGARIVGFGFAACLLVAGADLSAQAPSTRRLDLPRGTVAGQDATFWTKALAASGDPLSPKRERLIVVASDGRVLETADGTEDHVLLSVEMASALSCGRVHGTLVHNHTASVGLSGADLRQLAKPGVDRVIAVGSDGTVYEATARAEAATLDSGLYESVLEHLKPRVTSAAYRGGYSPRDLYPHLPHLVTLVMQRSGLIDYRVTPGVAGKVDFLRYRDVFERVVEAEALSLGGADKSIGGPTSSRHPSSQTTGHRSF